jgi:peptidoglycan/LPS O-acetylase OafA/YrhL
VDVFFVISGYLISRLLLRAMQRTGRVRFVDFYGRRARRLMPTAAVVLAVTWLVARVVLPTSQLPATASQVRASALYFQNWVLAHNAVSYLTAHQAPTPVQHFWSLSVEEQFYVIWPMFFFAAGLAAAAVVTQTVRRRGSNGGLTHAFASRRMMLGFAVTILLISFGWSVHQTAANPASAYYVTTTRMWELAGLVLILIAAFTLSAGTRFPGSIALLPVIGAVLMVSSGSSYAKVGPARFTSLPVLVFVGDISYALYLWHWPVIVLWRAWTGDAVTWLTAPLLAAVSIGLAWLTTHYVEDRVRLAGWFTAHNWRSVATVSAVVVPVTLSTVFIAHEPSAFHGRLNAAHPGAAVLAGDAQPPAPAPWLPPAAVATTDLQLSANGRCEQSANRATPRVCRFGDTSHPSKTVALVGDSLAGEWSTALAAIGSREHWEIVTVIKNGCPWTATATAQLGQSAAWVPCQRWGVAALHVLVTQIHPDVVITSDRIFDGTAVGQSPGLGSEQAIARGMATYWTDLIHAGINVVAIREGPEMIQVIPDCLSSHGATVAGCSRPRAQAIATTTPITLAAQAMHPPVPVIDMNSLVCGPTTCSAVVGNVIVYRDSHHLSNTYTRTLEPYLQRKLLATNDFGASS